MLHRLVGAMSLACTGLVSGQTFSSAHWFFPGNHERQMDYEQALNRVPEAAELARWHELMGSAPHVAGTAADAKLIQRQAELFRAMGLDVEVHEFWALLATPVEAKLQLIFSNETPSSAPAASATAPGQRTRLIALPIREDALLDDPFVAHPDLSYGWNAYSGSGAVHGEIVYANYGTLDDFQTLKRLGIDCAGKVVLARYGKNFRGYKARFAQEAGAAALVIYTDPDDSGYRKGVPYPEGGWANDTCVQRGSINTLPWPGDPLTPGRPATADAQRLDPGTLDLPRIPVQPIGYRAAAAIMARMAGTPLPAELIESWQGGLPSAYRLTSGPGVQLSVLVKQAREIKRSANVIATLQGSRYPEQQVIIGCHHDAWGYGAADPLAGTILVFEAARSFAELARQGQRPDRTIVFATWGAEEFGIIGSTEFCEANADRLRREAVAYINLDAAALGPDFHAGAAPVLKKLIAEAARDVPQARDPARSVYDAWCAGKEHPEISNLGGGSDHVGFYCHLGIPSCHLGAGGAPGTAYHSNYDNLAWYRQTVGDDYQPALMLTRLVNLLAARLANAAVPPLDLAATPRDFLTHLDSITRTSTGPNSNREGAATNLPDSQPATTESLREKAKGLQLQCERAMDLVFETLASGRLSAESAGEINQLMLTAERDWLALAPESPGDPTATQPSEPSHNSASGGLPGRPWWRHLFAASDLNSGYAASMLPALREAIAANDREARAAAEHALDQAIERQKDRIGRLIDVLNPTQPPP